MSPLKEVLGNFERIKSLAEGRISPHVDVKYVYDTLFNSKTPPPKHEAYCRRDEFLSLTYPTPRMLEWIKRIINVLAGKPSKNVFVLPAYFGAGKSHFLALLLHVLALYRDCNGSGICVSEKLKKYDIDIELPSLERVPNMILFHGEHEEIPPWKAIGMSRMPSKEKVKEWIEEQKPILIVFDETGMFDNRHKKSFADFMQVLSETVAETGSGVAIVVSYSLTNVEVPESYDRIKRVGFLHIDLDVLKNIVEIFKRWAGVKERIWCSDIRGSLVGAVREEEVLNQFCNELKESYPFNPGTLKTLLTLAEESLAKATKIQLTRDLLRQMAKAAVSAASRGGELVIHVDLPEPEDVIVPPEGYESFWRSLQRLYKKDVMRASSELEGHDALVLNSMLKHIFYTSFIGRLLPRSKVYPSDMELLLYNFDPAIGILHYTNAIRVLGEGKYRVAKTRLGYLYAPVVAGVDDVIRHAMEFFSSEDGLKAVTNDIEQILKNVRHFDYVVIVGWKDADSHENKLYSFADHRTAEKFIKEHEDESILLVDLRGISVKSRNNLLVLKPQDISLEAKSEGRRIAEFLRRFAVPPEKLGDALVLLGRVKCAVSEIMENLRDHFHELTTIEDEQLRRIMEEYVKSALTNISAETLRLIKDGIKIWLSRYSVGGRENRGGLGDILKHINNVREEDVVKDVLNNAKGFVRLGDLWSQWLNFGRLWYPLNFSRFVNCVIDICREDCSCIFREGDEYRWLTSKGGCEYVYPSDTRNTEVALAFIEGNPNEPVIETYLTYLAELQKRRGIRVLVEYYDYVTVRRIPVDELLAKKSDWIYLRTAKIIEERITKQFDILVNGLSQPTVEVKRNEPLSVEVISSEQFANVTFELNGNIFDSVLSSDRRRATVTIVSPGESGEYALKVMAEFSDGSREERTVLIKVKGKVKVEKTCATISEGKELVGISMLSRRSSEDMILKVLRNKDLLEKLRIVELEGSVRGECMNFDIKLKYEVADRDALTRVLRVLKAIDGITEAVKVTIRFKEPIIVQKSLIEMFRKSDAEWKVLEEIEV